MMKKKPELPFCDRVCWDYDIYKESKRMCTLFFRKEREEPRILGRCRVAKQPNQCMKHLFLLSRL